LKAVNVYEEEIQLHGSPPNDSPLKARLDKAKPFLFAAQFLGLVDLH
jgi:hypothetical protein